jgi:FG-GAP repeat/FG-GAP-like repeat
MCARSLRSSLACLLALAAGAQAQMTLAELNGFTANFNFGQAVAPAGDMDKDGFPDLLVGAPGSASSGPNTGQVYLISGKSQSTLSWKLGPSQNSYFGTAVAGGVDVDKDGWPDYVVGSPYESLGPVEYAGGVRLYSGKTGTVLQTWWGTSINSLFGTWVAFVGDWNGDGWQDLAAGAPGGLNVQGAAVGYVRVYSGLSGSVLMSFYGQGGGEYFGYSFAAVGDWNGDGTPDMAAGAPLHHSGLAYVGRVDVRSGSNDAVLSTWSGSSDWEQVGWAMARLPDVNGDGRDDLALGAPSAGLPGRVDVVLGGSGAPWFTVTGQTSQEQLGFSLATAGDVDHDGVTDFVAGAPYAANGGNVRVYSGASGQVLWTTIAGNKPDDYFGGSVAGVGDLDGDGWSDLAIGGSGVDTSGTSAGAVRLVRAAVPQADLGFGGPGSAKLAIYGEPLGPTGTADLRLTGAVAGKPAFLLASLVQQPTPFKGGTLVPQAATALLLPLATDAQGKITLQGIPGGGGPLDIHVQVLVLDAQQPKGVAFSNAVKAVFLP